MPVHCTKCLQLVPEWFMEQLFPLGGAFHVPTRDAGIFDNVEWPFESEGEVPEFAPRPRSVGRDGYACYQCTNGWPYPVGGDEEDYVEFLSRWRADQKELDDGEPR